MWKNPFFKKVRDWHLKNFLYVENFFQKVRDWHLKNFLNVENFFQKVRDWHLKNFLYVENGFFTRKVRDWHLKNFLYVENFFKKYVTDIWKISYMWKIFFKKYVTDRLTLKTVFVGQRCSSPSGRQQNRQFFPIKIFFSKFLSQKIGNFSQ